MVCPHCEGAEDVFSRGYAKKDLEAYREKGASKTTQLMITLFKSIGVSNKSLLDIGGGVGAISHDLISAGLTHAVDVDASTAYLKVAKEEAEQRGHADKIQFLHGDFVQLAPEIDAADIVSLDRVVCCYPDFHALVDLSSQRARELYGLVYPRDNFLTKLAIPIFNFFAFRLWGNPFRTFVHDSKTIDNIITGNGLQQIHHKNVGFWQVRIYRRT